MPVMVGRIACILHDIGMDGDIKAHHIVMAVGPHDCLWQALTTNAQFRQKKIPKLSMVTWTVAKGLLGKVNVPLVASGHLDHVKCMIVGCCLGEIIVLVSPGVHQGNPLVMQLLIQLV